MRLMLDLSSLRWLKLVTPDADHKIPWAYTRQHLEELKEYMEKVWKSKNLFIELETITIFPLGFRNEKQAQRPAEGDYLALIQRRKLTHIVEVLDKSPYLCGSWEKEDKRGDWFHRIVKVLCWKQDPEGYDILPSVEEMLGFDPGLQNGYPCSIECKRFHERWKNDDNMEEFQNYLAQKLTQYEMLR